MAAYAAAVLAKEPTRLAELYAPDVRVFDAWGVWSFDNRDAWNRNLEDWLGSLGNEGVQVQFDDVRVAEHAETRSLSAIVTYSAVDAAGHVVRSMQNRLSWFLTKVAGRWVISHEHTSAPISFENQKAILRRE
jgi:ketosteroid isomerase-like protein